MISGLVSIIMPAFNAGGTIESSIDSVRAQTHADWELLVVDDCSNDASAEIVHAIAGRDPRVRLIRQARNRGSGAARALALAEARGRYLAFLDSDDLWLPGKLERQKAVLAETAMGFCFTAYRRFDNNPQQPGRLIEVPVRIDYRELLKETTIATSTVLLDRQLVPPVEIRDVYHDDFVLWLYLLRESARPALGLNEDWVRYRVSRGSKSYNRLRMARMVWRTYRDVEHLSVLDAAWCFAHYSTRALLKHARF